eukprot:m.63585 g.63585  ORF g.63585 m.63585 type:complete len:77 (-) comp11958_c0_seq2:167-397(-)
MSLTHTLQRLHTRSGSTTPWKGMGSVEALHELQNEWPHALQWCLLRAVENDAWQEKHSEPFSQVGGGSVKGTFKAT